MFSPSIEKNYCHSLCCHICDWEVRKWKLSSHTTLIEAYGSQREEGQSATGATDVTFCSNAFQVDNPAQPFKPPAKIRGLNGKNTRATGGNAGITSSQAPNKSPTARVFPGYHRLALAVRSVALLMTMYNLGHKRVTVLLRN